MNILIERADTDNTKAQQLALKLQNPQHIFNYVKDTIKYKKDSVFKGTTTPDQTLKAGIGNCVDKSLLSKAMLDAIHIPNRLVLKYNSKEPEAHIFNQIVYNGQWTDFDTSCNTCTIGRTFSNNWETIAVISNKDTFIFNRKIYKELMEA